MHQYLIREQASLDTLSCFQALALLLHMQLLISLDSLVDACNLMPNQFSFLTSSPMSKSSTPGSADKSPGEQYILYGSEETSFCKMQDFVEECISWESLTQFSPSMYHSSMYLVVSSSSQVSQVGNLHSSWHNLPLNKAMLTLTFLETGQRNHTTHKTSLFSFIQ